MKMPRNKKALNVYVAPEILERLELWMKSQEAPWNKTAVVEASLSLFLDKKEAEDE